MSIKDRLSRIQAEEAGFTVDEHTYPWVAYKGARFAPTESVLVLTDLEAHLRDEVAELRTRLREQS